MPTVLITGCDYGIGFEFARQYAADNWQVHATCLNTDSKSTVLALGERVSFHHLDVTDNSALLSLAGALGDTPVDLLINNAATFAADGPGTLMLPEMSEFSHVMTVNAVAPVYVADAFVAHVASSTQKKMVFISTRSGSIGDNSSGGHYAYRCSKAALNMAVKSLSVNLRQRDIIATVLHPGSVRTETRTGGTGIPVAESVSSMRQIIATLTLTESGTFLRYDSGEIEW